MNRSKVYLIVQTVVCVALAALLAASAVSIYREGAARRALNPLESIYTPEIVAGRFAPLAPLCFASLGLLAAGLLLGVKDEHSEKPVRDAAIARDLTVSRVSKPSEAMRREQRTQRWLTAIGWGVFLLCMAPVALYLSDAAHFPAADPEIMFHGLIRVFLPWAALGLGVLSVTALLREKSILRQTEAAAARIREEKAEGTSPAAPVPGAHRRCEEMSWTIMRRINLHMQGGGGRRCGASLTDDNAADGDLDKQNVQIISEQCHRGWGVGVVRAAFLAAAVALIIAGILNGSARDVLYKAITICTECVGLG